MENVKKYSLGLLPNPHFVDYNKNYQENDDKTFDDDINNNLKYKKTFAPSPLAYAK